MTTVSTLTKTTITLGDARVGFRGRITALDMTRAPAAGLPAPELERRLLELGFVEGATVELLHQGLFGGDPIAVRVAATTIALRRREAMAVMVSQQDLKS
jgi:ferrous iron transport protein A